MRILQGKPLQNIAHSCLDMSVCVMHCDETSLFLEPNLLGLVEKAESKSLVPIKDLKFHLQKLALNNVEEMSQTL